VETANAQAFLIGVIFLSVGGYLVFDMQTDTAWTTYSSEDTDEYFDGDFWWTVEVTTDMEIGLQETYLGAEGQECIDSRDCKPIDVGSTMKILELPEEIEDRDEPIDCDSTKEKADIELCDIASAGSIADTLLTTGLGFLGLTVLLSLVGVFGYIPGRILKLLSSISSAVVFIGPILWYLMIPDLNADFSATEEKWGLAKGFYLTLLSAPLIFVGGRFFGEMEAFAYEEEEEDWDEEDESFFDDEEYSPFADYDETPRTDLSQSSRGVDVALQGVLDEEGYEWLEYPDESGEWYWRDHDTGEWVRY